MSQKPTPDVPSDTHCEFCGLAYEDVGSPEEQSKRTADTAPPVDEVAPPKGGAAPFLTHCEYCGTEFPDGDAESPTADADADA